MTDGTGRIDGRGSSGSVSGDGLFSPLTAKLNSAPAWIGGGYAVVAAFSTYFCMYAFRKPFAAGSFESEGPFVGSLSLKTTFVVVQIIGYALSKFLGARFLPELSAPRRARALLGLIGVSWTALLFFALVPPWAQAAALFVNGLCLGMIWGLVVAYLEGRRSSEVLLAGLSCSFIVASGAVKDVGRWLMRDWGVSEAWMPFATGAVFVLPLVASVWMLRRVPAPTEDDVRERCRRTTMDASERRQFVKEIFVPLCLLLTAYLVLTAYRDYRDNYGVELFAQLGYENEPALFTSTELPVAVLVLVAMAALSWVENNRRALIAVFSVMSCGLLLLSVATTLLQAGLVSGTSWMILVGLGSYLTYVPFGSVLFDRLLAHRNAGGTAVFGIYLADALGYTGSVLVQLYSDLVNQTQTRLEFFFDLTHALSWSGALLLVASGVWLLRRPVSPAPA